MIVNPFDIREDNKESSKKDIGIISQEISEALINNDILQLTNQDKKYIKNKIKEKVYSNYKENIENIREITEQIMDKIYGYGILEKYIKDGITSDIRVTSFKDVYIKQLGKWKKVNENFESEEKLQTYIKFCALKNGANINFEIPIVTFSDRQNYLRIEAGIYPASVLNSSIVIRIHRNNKNQTLESLWIKDEMMNKKQYLFLIKAIEERKSIIICGQGGSGKTTLLKNLLNKLPEEVAITTNEETSEMYLEDRNIIQRECILSRTEEKNIDLETLAKHALVMSNDVIVIGEMKGKEANVFFDSISTGHMGLATIHSDDARNAVERIITLIKKDIKAQYYTEEFLKKFLSKSIDIIIFMKDYKMRQVFKLEYDEENRKTRYVDIISGKDI